jgi:hypothetical protein
MSLGECAMTNDRYLPVLALLMLGSLVTSASAETPQDAIAAQVRIQGVACGKALSARQLKKQSKPDHEVWILKCDNATYRVSRYPDRGAMIEQLR